MPSKTYYVTVRDSADVVLYRKVRRAPYAKVLIDEMIRRFPNYDSIDCAPSYKCVRCGQRIDDGKECGCGARY